MPQDLGQRVLSKQFAEEPGFGIRLGLVSDWVSYGTRFGIGTRFRIELDLISGLGFVSKLGLYQGIALAIPLDLASVVPL